MDTTTSGGLPVLRITGQFSLFPIPTVVSGHLPDLGRDRRLCEGRVNRVYGNGIVRVRSVATDIDDNPQTSVLPRSSDLLLRHERGDRGTEIDAVDENISLQDLGERTALGRLIHVPLQNVIPARQ